MEQGTPLLKEDVRSPAAALGLDFFVRAQIVSPVYGQKFHSHMDKGSQSPSYFFLFHLDQTTIWPFNQPIILKP
jgi:hypothetical protein